MRRVGNYMPLLSNKSFYSSGNFTPSYNTANYSSRRNVSLPKIASSLAIVVVILSSVTYGFLNFKNKDSNSVNKLGKEYVSYIVRGEYDKAYSLSSGAIKNSRTAAQFSSSLSGLKSPLPYYGRPQKVIFNNNEAHFYMKVDNLPPTASGRKDGIFALTFVKDKGWKVSNITIQ